MAIEIHPDQERLVPPIVTALNESRGVVDTDALEDFNYGRERTNITMLSGAIGTALTTEPRNASMTDRALEVFPNDFRRGGLTLLSSGLYIPRSNRTKEPKRVIRIGGDEEPDLQIPGVVGRYVGVVVAHREFRAIARSPRDLAAHTIAMALDANELERNREAADETAERAAAHVLDDKIVKMDALDSRWIDEADILRSLYKDARFPWRTAHRYKSLNIKRKEAEELVHDTIEVAARSLGYGTTVVEATHRAWTSVLTRTPAPDKRAEGWRVITEWAGKYRNSKRGKVNQSIKACYEERMKYHEAEPIDEKTWELYEKHIRRLRTA